MLFKSRDKERAASEMEQIVYYANPCGIIVGSFIINSEGYVSDLSIKKKYRGQGYGNRMIAEMVEQFGNRNKPLHLMVLPENTRAQHLYQKYGFTITKKAKYYYSMIYERV